MNKHIKCVLFDLDGTLVDTAPDMAFALNQTLARQGREPLPAAVIRPSVSMGGVALVKLAFQLDGTEPAFTRLHDEFLAIYRANLCRDSRLFPGMEQVLSKLEQAGLSWGIVTNKPGWLTDPLMQALALDTRTPCIVSGDTLAQRKPHPAPLLHACQLLRRTPEETVYIGDDRRDIQAGNSAGAATLAAAYGYIGPGEDPHTWGADGLLERPQQILPWLGQQ
ncbi:MAG: phosphoglycolate phosphatase [Gammaproteobacteria bacterium]|nr:phosphoglycolate phosphatase [Gammaproteobacteria bacterium]MCY4210241.1 phosphoglycolate phosphatase [Gammaproteobacteria bacterium]MCY4282226.1 phosphoglycolate phosphatase [Gammaproteobacteria bacterium]MCY4339601.1 phosphoglycolate phosphatase [Gammaproteobacteria bacterium]